MTPIDYDFFEQSFKRMCLAFRLKLKAVEIDELAHTYFRVLEEFPLDVVLLAGKTWVAKSRKFPKAADWRDAIAHDASPSAPAECRQMSAAELDEFALAEQMRWFDGPCLCSECCRAGVDDLEVRFVPSLAGDDEERAFNPRRNNVQITGHWAHGEELRRWYEAKAAYVTTARHSRGLRLMPALREVGEEG